jgi:hypothetical protein
VSSPATGSRGRPDFPRDRGAAWHAAVTVTTHVLADVARAYLAAVMLAAAALKWTHIQDFQQTLTGIGLTEASAARTRSIVPALEAACAIALLLTPQGGAIATLLLLVVFSSTAAIVHLRGLRIGCSCFGSGARSYLGPRTIARNAALGLAGLAVLVWLPGTSLPTLPAGLIGLQLAASSWLVVTSIDVATLSREDLRQVVRRRLAAGDDLP